MRRRAIAEFTTKTKPYITYGTQDMYITVEMHPPQYCPHVLDLQVTRRAIANLTAKSKPSSRFEKNRRFNKDILIQIGKPKYRETPMKSKARHVDGGSGNAHFHWKFVRQIYL